MGDSFHVGVGGSVKKLSSEPQPLLRIKELQALLQKEMASEECVKEIMVFSIDGFLLACSSTTEAGQLVADTIAATLAPMYAGCAHGHTMLVDAEHGCGVVGSVAEAENLVFCIWAKPGAPAGLLRAKLNCLNNNLARQLEGIIPYHTDLVQASQPF